MRDTAPLRALMIDYDRLRSLDGGELTPHARGSLFNQLIADMLQIWGINARTSVVTPGTGEIDVSLMIDGQRYILEAKWEQQKTKFDPLAKLAMRVKQRMRGTIGVFVSMAGYTDDAVTGLTATGEGSVLLLDRGHVEAMVSGLVPPAELLHLVADSAAFRGKWYAPLHELLAPDQDIPSVSFNTAGDSLNGTVAPGVIASVVCNLSATGFVGMVRSDPSKVLLTVDGGIAEVNLDKQTVRWGAPVQGCHGNPVLRPDHSIVFTRRHGVAAVSTEGIQVLDGGFSDRSILFTRPDGSICVLDPRPTQHYTTSTVVLIDGFGQSGRYEIVTPHPWPVGAVWLDETRLALIHDSSCSLAELDAGIVGQLRFGTSRCVGMVPLVEGTCLTISGHAELQLTDRVTGRYATVGALHLKPPVLGLTGGDKHDVYIAVAAGDSTAIVRVTVESPLARFVAHTFARTDSGDLDGYRAEVTKLAGRSEQRSRRTAEQSNKIYNDARRLVDEQLSQPLKIKIEKLGLEPWIGSPLRSLDGSSPPGYGGGASCPRWLGPNNSRAWLEARIGVSYRVWPAENPDELIVTLMLAAMTEQQQHTLLTRFVPFVPEDTGLPAKIATILTDAEVVLPQATEVLALFEQQQTSDAT